MAEVRRFVPATGKKEAKLIWESLLAGKSRLESGETQPASQVQHHGMCLVSRMS
jgi:hypothetical protein